MMRRAKPMNRTKIAGFTLFEVAIVLAILGMIAFYGTPNFLQDLNEKRSNVAIQETQTILDAARVYRLKMGHWPAEPVCETAKAFLEQQTPPFLAGISDSSKFNSTYITECDAYTFSVTQNVIKDWDEVMVNGLPGSVITDPVAHTIVSTIGIPGTEPALDAKLSRIATDDPEDNTMRTNIDMGDNNINNLNTLNSKTIVNSGTATIMGRLITGEYIQVGGTGVTLESACSPNGLMGKTATGMIAFCQSGTWARPARWYSNRVTNGGACTGAGGEGTFAFDNANKLYVCK